jgi:putative hydrolase of HD superfamily
MSNDASERLARQITFLLEADRLKGIIRRSHIPGLGRRENTAEHSWHLALAALLLAEHSNEKIDVAKTVFMVLIHDMVEIDAGDTYIYDTQGQDGRLERERIAAGRIFGLLPEDQRDWVRSLWEEFEARETPESRFAAAIDRLLPLLHNYHTQGLAWQEHGIARSQVYDANAHIERGSAAVWQAAQDLIEEAVRRGYLNPDATPAA